MKCRIHTIIKQERKRNDCSPERLKKLEEECIKEMLKGKENKYEKSEH